jgi:N-glycosylase/DNA lyase
VAWSEWQTLPLRSPADAAVLAEILDGGQAFRWHRDAAGVWTGIWGDCAVRLRLAAGAGLQWSAPAARAAAAGPALAEYLRAGDDTSAEADALPWRSDPHLARCLAAFPGLRLLRQPLGETLLGFLCSATKRIAQIKQMVALLAERQGAPLDAAPSAFHRLPTWVELAGASEADLRACRLGFRARHIRATAQFLAGHPGWLEETAAAPYPAARDRLALLPGVGAKVADCVLLFGAGRPEAFPVDTWILRAMARHYGLSGWKPAQVAHFGRAHFGPRAGLAQQYLFAWERRHRE